MGNRAVAHLLERDPALGLRGTMGNRAVAHLLQRDPLTKPGPTPPAKVPPVKPSPAPGPTPGPAPGAKTQPAPASKPAENLWFAISTDPDDAIVFETKRATLRGGGEAYCTGRLSIQGAATFEGESIPDAKHLPKAHGAPSIPAWTAEHVRQQAKNTLQASAPEGTLDEIVLHIGGKVLSLDLDRDNEGHEPFGVAGKFEFDSLDLTFGSLKIARAKVRLDTTMWVTPPPLGFLMSPVPPAGEKAVLGFQFAGRGIWLDDRLSGKDPSHTVRTGAVASWASVDRLERELPPALLSHPALKNREQRVALLQQMRPYFGSDDRTIEHFKGIRRVFLHDASKASDLWMHEEAASRLEAVRDELPAGAMPMSTVGWPRYGHSLGLIGNIADLHDMGMAVDFNAYEMPKLGKDSVLEKDLVKAITGKIQMEIPVMTGPYKDRPHEGPWSTMAKRTAERGKMPDPAPGSSEANLLDLTVAEAEDASARSEQFKHSLDRTDAEGKTIDGRAEMARLRTSFLEARSKGGPKWTDAQWSQADRDAFTRLVEPWADVVDQQKAEHQAKLEAAGFKIDALPRGKDLDKEKAKWKEALAAAAKLRAQIKGDTPSAPQQTALGPLLERLRTLLGRQAPDPAAAAATPVAELDELLAAATTHLAGFDEISEFDRAAKLRAALDSPAWVLGTTAQLQVNDPSPAQMLEHGFFNLRDNSANKSAAVTVEFIRAMVKHGFVPLAATENPDFMHFELRWWAPAKEGKH